MTELSLYNSCLRKVSLLSDRIWKSGHVNPFCFLPSEVVHDLVSTTLHFHYLSGFRAAGLELLLSSGMLREFKMHAKHVAQEFGPVLKSLASACQNLEALTLTNLTFGINSQESSEALQELLRNSPNLRIIHCSVKFDLKALRNCKKLRRIMLHFEPEQPWYDFLGDEHGCLQPLHSLELFTLCKSGFNSPPIFADYIVTLLRYCPALTSLGLLETSRALAQLHQTGILPQVKLRSCSWGDFEYPDHEGPLNFGCPEWIRDSVAYHPFVEELHFYVYSIESIAYLSSLRNLVFLDLRAGVEGDLSVPFCNVLKDIGLQLKYLSFSIRCPIDLSVLLQNCPNLEALQICATEFTEFAKPVVRLPNLKHLTYYPEGTVNRAERQILPLFSNCYSLREIFLVNTVGFDDRILDKFLRSNSLSNLKIAFMERCGLTRHGFRKFFLNTPELEKIEIVGYFYKEGQELERLVKRALLETNHKALFNKNLVYFGDEFFLKKRSCKFY